MTTLDRQQRRHPKLVSIEIGELKRYRAIERDIQNQAELTSWQRRHTEPPAVPPKPVPKRRPYGGFTRMLVAQCGNGGHDYYPTRPR
jgi:hypothetical protein